ncbi:hypothetical protein FA13DRAFT_1712588 [Coprinellus micaceus]|uniref:Uncharacterized protein n=1 Tax=Coprinellus micaceus TaxID=71717 RepID=A0A4Y7T0K4_COPMI|nr:hypothetical protein FA13DRAFT_1712588 [Coprinellus micaceus]
MRTVIQLKAGGRIRWKPVLFSLHQSQAQDGLDNATHRGTDSLQPCYSPARNRALRSTELARRLVTPGQVSPHVRQIVGGAVRRYTTSSQWQPPTYEPVNAFPKVFRVITGEPMVRGEKYGYYSVALDSTLMSDWLWEWAKFISYLLRTVSKAAGLGAFCGCFEGRPPVLRDEGSEPFLIPSGSTRHRNIATAAASQLYLRGHAGDFRSRFPTPTSNLTSTFHILRGAH